MLPDFIKFSNNLLLATDRETRLKKFSKDKNFPFTSLSLTKSSIAA